MPPHISPDALPPAHQPRDRGASWTWGVRAATALLAGGGYAVLVGGVFLLPFAIDANAIQNDVYMSNYFIGLPVLVVGAICVLAGLLGLGLSREGHGPLRWLLALRAAVLAVAGAAVVAIATLLFGGRYYSVGPFATDWPPYLTLEIVVLAVAVGLAVFIAGWIWAAGAAGATQGQERTVR